MNINSLMRLMFGTVIRVSIYRGMRNSPGILLIGLALVAAIGYALVTS